MSKFYGTKMELSARGRVLFSAVFWFSVALFLTAYSSRNPEVAGLGSGIVSEIVKPFQVLSHSSKNTVVGFWKNYVFLVGLKQEVGNLSARVNTLEAQNSELLEYKTENMRLRELLGVAKDNGLNGVAAVVIGHDPSNWVRAIFVDQGINVGVRVGMPVVSGNGVVGQVIAVGANSAKVLLLSDHLSGVDALVQRSRARGVVEGTGGRLLRLSFVEKRGSVEKEDRIITSGLDGVYPKGLLVGSVVEVDENSGGLFQSVVIKPAVSVDDLETVLIVKEELRQQLD